MKKLLPKIAIALSLLFQGCATLEPGPLSSGQIATVVRADGLLVLLPAAGGPGTYGTYLVPDALGRENPARFLYRGNPLQINFLPEENFPRGFGALPDDEKLKTFFAAEIEHQRRNFGPSVKLQNERSFRSGGVAYRSGTMRISLPTPQGNQNLEVFILARVAGNGILHGGWQVANPRTISAGESMVRKMLASFRLVRTPLDGEELARLSKEASAGR